MRRAFLLAMTGLVLIPTFSAQAQDRHDADMSTRIGAKLMLGLGGEADYDDFRINGIGFAPNIEDDMETTAGLGFTLDVPFHQYFTAGGFLAFHSWNSETVEDAYDDFTLVDLGGFIKARYPTRLGKMGFEPYVMLPLGFSLNFPDDDLQDDTEMEVGTGWNIGLLFGAILFVSDDIGLNVELGYTSHALHHEFDTAGEPDGDIEIGQASFNLGVVIALD
jgi:hypothetical protein